MPQASLTDEGIILAVHDFGPGKVWVRLDTGNFYRVSRRCGQDPRSFEGATVRLLLTMAHRVWDISVI